MKGTLSKIALAVLTMGLLGSCSKINERLDNLDKRIDGIESEQIASINSQIAGITSSISDLETIRTNIRTLFDEGKVQGESIAALQAADKALEEKIADLRNYMDTELKKYAESEWVSATFATLEQYEEVCRTIEEIEKGVGDLDERLSKSLRETKDTFTAAIKDLSDRVGVLESKVQTIDGQIEAIISSISDLETIRESIKALTASTEAQGEDIGELKEADEAIGKKIGELKEADEAIGERIEDLKAFVNDTLKTYPTSEWVKATYATLAQYKETCDSIAKVEAKFGATSEKLSNDIKACTDSLARWINEEFKGYYTAAQMDAKEKEIRAAIDTARGVSEKTSDSIRTELSKVRVDIDTAKAAITREYTAAIAAAITESEGRLTADIQQAIGDVNDRITTISGTVDNLVTIVLNLLGKVKDLEAMVQSVTIVPAYKDGSLEDVEGGILTIDCIISPAKSAPSLKKENFTVLVNTVKTKSTTFEKAEISDIRIGENGIVSIFALAPSAPASGSAYTVAVNVKSGAITDYTTEFHSFGYSDKNVKVVDLKENDTEYNKVYIVPSNSTDPKTVGGAIPAVIEDGKKTFDGNKPTVIEVRGIGTVTFDKTATAKIAENANGADKVYFTVKDVTSDAQKQAKEIVYQVTMTTVDANTGKEVFSETNAAGEVTMEIPLGSDVADVTKVTLLNENGNPIEGGVVYGSIVYDREKHIITFKVNHFSKYAVGYVLQKDYKPVTGISLDKSALELEKSTFKKLIATIKPDDASNRNVIWSSSDTTKVTVDKDGKVTAVAEGKATITATSMNNRSLTATCEVTVVELKSYVEIAAKYNGSTVSTLRWYRQSLAITASGNKAWKGGSGSAVKIPGTDEDVVVGDYFQWGTFAGFYGSGADSDKGLLPYSSFTNTKCGDGSDKFTFKSGKQFNQTNAPYWSGSAYTKYNATDKKTELDASDDVASIILGGTWRMPTTKEFQALKEVTYWAWDETDEGYYVYTPNPASDAGKVNNGTGTYDKADALLFFPAAGNGYTSTYYDAGKLGDFWTGSLNSANPSKGCILYLNGEEGSIDAASNDSDRYRGYSVRPVQDPAATYKAVSGVTFDVEKKEVVEGGNVQLSATVTPADATNKGVYWTSSDTTVAKVDALGKVTAVKAGIATITATTVDGNKTATCAVTVKITTFKAVYDTNGDANTLTFYYDANDHSGEGITVYDNLPTAATKAADWGYNGKRGEIKSVVIDASVAGYKGLTSTAYMFQGMTAASDISGAEYLYVSNVTDMSLMFMNFGGGSTNSHTTLNSVPDVSNWNTANVTNMTGMFWDYGNFSDNLTKVPDVSKWNTANVTNMAGMFQQYGYSSINFNDVPKVSGWSTVSVEDMSTMFRYYGKNSTALTAVPDVCNWNTAEVKTMAEMFREYGASSTVLKAVPDVSGWNTSNVTTMINLFQNYGKGSVDFVLDLSGWDLSKITSNKGDNVFDFTPNTFNVTIPAKTGEKSNEGGKWYYGDGTNSIAPPAGKTFTLLPAGVSGNGTEQYENNSNPDWFSK